MRAVVAAEVVAEEGCCFHLGYRRHCCLRHLVVVWRGIIDAVVT